VNRELLVPTAGARHGQLSCAGELAVMADTGELQHAALSLRCLYATRVIASRSRTAITRRVHRPIDKQGPCTLPRPETDT
jgi:hypothetical protein